MRGRKLAVGAAVATAVLGFTMTNAWAHVTVSPKTAPKGSDATLTFVVPNEMDNANTVEVKMQMPPDHPFSSVAVKPVPGWTADVQTTTLSTPIQGDSGPVSQVVSTIDWKGGQIKPGEFGEFEISVALPSDADILYFKTIQTYDNGQTVSWIELPNADGTEPENPAPSVVLTAAEDTTGASTSTTVAGATPTTESAAGPTVTAQSTAAEAALTSELNSVKDDVDTNKTLAEVGVALGAIALVAAIGAIFMARRSSGPDQAEPAPASAGPSGSEPPPEAPPTA